MIVKIAGISLVLIASFLAGHSMVNQIKERKKELENIELLFEKIREKAINNMCNISECINDSIVDMDFKCKFRFENLVNNLQSNQFTELSQAWKATKCDMYPLNKDDIEILDNFFAQSESEALGMYIGKLDEMIKKIKSNQDKINETFAKNKKMYYNICISTGILTVILLI